MLLYTGNGNTGIKNIDNGLLKSASLQICGWNEDSDLHTGIEQFSHLPVWNFQEVPRTAKLYYKYKKVIYKSP